MSAIFGLYYKCGRSIKQNALQDMGKSMIHRGIKGIKTWNNTSIGIGQLNGINKPKITESLSYHHLNIVLDGRLDYRPELIYKLGLQEHNNYIYSDEDLIAQAYLKWQDKCVDNLFGEFTFAIWDEKSHVLFLANDHIGIRNVYYYNDQNLFAFASEISALKKVKEIKITHNQDKITSFVLGYQYLNLGEESYYKNIFRLKRSSLVKVTKASLELKDYWNLKDNASKIKYNNDTDYVDDFKQKFIKAVESRTKDQVKIAVALSGGLDSSTITCVAKKQSKNKIHTYHVKSQYNDSHESEYKNAVVDSCNVIDKEIPALDTYRSAYEVSKYLDQPIQANHLGVMYAVWKSMTSDGVNIILSGEDGDGIVNDGHYYPQTVLQNKGYNTYKQIIYQRYKNRYFNNFKKTFKDEKGYLKYSNGIFFHDYLANALNEKEYLNFITMVSNGLMHNFNFSAKPILRSIYSKYINSNRIALRHSYKNSFYNEIALPLIKNKLIDSKSPYFTSVTEEHIYHIKNTPVYYNEDSNYISERLNINIRYPFMDRKIIELCVSAPEKLKWYKGIGRGVLRESMRGILPDKIRKRKSKSDFTQHIIESFRKNEIEFYKDQYLNLRSNTYFNESYLKEILLDFENKNIPHYQLQNKFNTLRKHAYLSNWFLKN